MTTPTPTPPEPPDPRSLVPQLSAGVPDADADRAARELAALAETPEGALGVLRALLEVAGRTDAAAACDAEPEADRKGEALSLLAWMLADQHHDQTAERVARDAIALGLRRAATDALLLVLERRGGAGEECDALRARYLESNDEEGYHALVALQTAAQQAWEQDDLARATSLSLALVERSPADVAALFRAGYGLYCSGRHAEALSLLDRWHRWTKDSDALLPRAGCLYGLGRYDEAMAVLGELLADEDTGHELRVHAWALIAWCELGKGLLDRAEGALERARALLAEAGGGDAAVLGPVLGDLDAIEGVVDVLSGQLDLASRILVRLRRSGSRSAPLLEEAIVDVESGRVRPFGPELARHRRARPRGSLADRLAGATAGTVVELENGTWEAGGVELPAGVTVRGQGPETILTAPDGPVVTARGQGGALERLSIVLPRGAAEDREALLVEGGDLRVTDCVIEARSGIAASARLDARPTLERCELRGGLGLAVRDQAAPIVRGGHVTGGPRRFAVHFGGQSAGELREVELGPCDWAAVRIEGSSTALVSGCRVHGSKGGSGIWIGADARPLVEGNEVWDNRYPGILADDRCRPVIRGNVVHHHSCSAIQLAKESEALVEGNEVRDVDASLIECLHTSKGTLRSNRLLGGTGPGIWVLHESAPTLEGNVIEGTRRAGIEAAYKARPQGQGNRVERSQAAGLRFAEDAGGTLEGTMLIECLIGVEVRGSATPVLRGSRIERSAFAGLQSTSAGRLEVEGLTIVGGKVGIDLGGRSSIEARGLRVEGVEVTPLQAAMAARAVLTGARLEPASSASTTISIGGGAEIALHDCEVLGRADAPAIALAGAAVLRMERGRVDGAGRTPIVAGDTSRVRLHGVAIAASGGCAVEARGRAGVATIDVRADGELARLVGDASREPLEEPPSPDAHALAIVLLGASVGEREVEAALGPEAGPEGHVRFAIGAEPPPAASLAPLLEGAPALAAVLRDARAWVAIWRKPGVPDEQATAETRALARAVRRVVEASPALAVWSPRGARLVAASEWTNDRIEGAGLARLLCNVRATTIGTSVVVDTVGLAMFDQDDLQCEVPPAQREIVEPLLWALAEAIVTEPYRYGYRAATRPVGGKNQTFMLQECKHELAPPRRVWALQPIGDLGAGGGWAKQQKPTWGKPASKGLDA